MLNSPFQYEDWLTDAEYQKLGELALRWSHLDHIIGNCLSAILELNTEEAVVMVFPLSAEYRLTKLKELAELKEINDDARKALSALREVMGHIQKVRNNIIHAILVDDDNDGVVFHLRSKKRTLTKEQVFSIEELTNFAAHAALSLRYALGLKGSPGERHPLPDKPQLPDFLRNPIPNGIRLGRPLSPRPPTSHK